MFFEHDFEHDKESAGADVVIALFETRLTMG